MIQISAKFDPHQSRPGCQRIITGRTLYQQGAGSGEYRFPVPRIGWEGCISVVSGRLGFRFHYRWRCSISHAGRAFDASRRCRFPKSAMSDFRVLCPQTRSGFSILKRFQHRPGHKPPGRVIHRETALSTPRLRIDRFAALHQSKGCGQISRRTRKPTEDLEFHTAA